MKPLCITVLMVLFFQIPAHAEIMTSLMALEAGVSSGSDESRAKFQALKQKMENDPDAWQAYLTVTRSVPADISNSLRDEYRQLATALVLKAARANNPDALTLVFTRYDVLDFWSARPQLVNALLTAAEKASGTAGDTGILTAAGDVLQNGILVVQNSLRAAAFYARAWHAGSDEAASRLNALFMSIKDPASAYLWALRCTGKCHLDEDHKAREMLTPRQITSIQVLARDSRILTVNGLGAQEVIR
ncbi:hypothetical protein [Kosakonia sp. MH5]|uniref:hypothetical protein n=1 Tax=Kosakonia sp. MH5 TaxID=2202822 RepID=UPI001374F460|nr:hypothetical protein [Kosakonia sp. MH5]NCF08748.1 hypothetical protein [Kosakonia sp. MH5]